VFVNSMSDLFHAKVPLSFIQSVFEVMAATPGHTYQVLTKRARRLRRVADALSWPPNLWIGVSVEDERSFIVSMTFDKFPLEFVSCHASRFLDR